MPISPEGRPIRKGLGSFSRRISPADLEQLGISWYYNWTPFPKNTHVPGMEFVPMFWWGGDVNLENLALVQASDAVNVLGFNEPDLTSQSNMTVKECLDLWPQLMTLKQRLGSPAPASHVWLHLFLAGARERKLRVDFVCVHMYPDFTNPNAVGEMETQLREVHECSGLPVWLTEFSTADVKKWHQPQLHRPSSKAAESFMHKVLAMLERLPFIERYAWFADRVGGDYRFGSIFEQHSGRLTSMGAIYRGGPESGTPA